jgi:hypothetical protein
MSEFSMDFVSTTESEHLMIEVCYLGQRLCRLDKELGNDSIRIEFLTDQYVLPEPVAMLFSLREFGQVLREAESALRECP